MLSRNIIYNFRKIKGYLLILVIGVLISLVFLKCTDKKGENYKSDKVVNAEENVLEHKVIYENYNSDFTSAAEISVNAVVHIKTEFIHKNSIYDYFFDLRDIFGERKDYPQQRERIYAASGSGVIINSDGYIVTNNHVVQDANKITVILNDRRSYSAEIIGNDPSTDLALIKIEEKNLPFIAYGNSDKVKIGEWVLAVGNPFNLTSTVTAGIVSAKARNINILGRSSGSDTPIESFIQTDAAVNPGNSGGALVNTKGKLIGINAAIASGSGHYEGYSFAIPVNIVKKVINDILNYGEVQRAYLGILIRNIDSKFAKEKNINNVLGVYIAGVEGGGSAKKAGIREGDIIYKINNKKINTTSELLETIGQNSPGDKINILVKRENKDRNFNVILKNREGNTEMLKNHKIIILGATIKPLSKNKLSRYDIRNGFEITDLKNGIFKNNGIKKGFIITKINKNTLYTINDIKNTFNGGKGRVLIEGFYPNGIKAYYEIGL